MLCFMVPCPLCGQCSRSWNLNGRKQCGRGKRYGIIDDANVINNVITWEGVYYYLIQLAAGITFG